jgi:hypothetical protein
VTAVTYTAAQHGGRYIIVAYGALICGAVQFVIGLVQSSTAPYEPLGVDGALRNSNDEDIVVAGALVFFVRNPLEPSANEIEAIGRFVSISPEKIRETAVAMQREENGLNGFLARKNDIINPKVAARVIRGSNAVINADGHPRGAMEALVFLGTLLYLSEAEVRKLLKA